MDRRKQKEYAKTGGYTKTGPFRSFWFRCTYVRMRRRKIHSSPQLGRNFGPIAMSLAPEEPSSREYFLALVLCGSSQTFVDGDLK